MSMVDRKPLELLQDATSIELPTLTRVRQSSLKRLQARCQVLGELDADDDVTIVFVGSWGRLEVTQSSDNDLYILTRGEPRQDARPTMDDLRGAVEAIEGSFKEPGQEGTFGGEVVGLAQLVGNVGLDDDTNTNLTRRMLLVLESQGAVHLAGHEEARRTVVERYLSDTVKDYRPPRLFLNDVVRYWRTMCVDFAAKMQKRHGQGWGLRNAKLRTTRKLLFASGLLPLMRCSELRADEMSGFLIKQFAMPPSDRIADTLLHYRAYEAAVPVFRAYDQILELLDDDARRSELDGICSGPDADASESFRTAARLGTDIDDGLLDLLFSPALYRWTREFAIF